MSSNVTIAVLTGDLVGSVALGPEKVEQAMAALEHAAQGMEHWIGAPLHFTRHRGDGWQVVVRYPKFAIRAALMFRAAIRSLGNEFDTYIGLAEGNHVGYIPNDLNTITGKPFTWSGAELEKIKGRNLINRMGFGEATPSNGVLILADHISQGWTPTQAELMSIILDISNRPKNYTGIAKRLGKSRQTISKSLDAAGFDSISLALSGIEFEDAQ